MPTVAVSAAASSLDYMTDPQRPDINETKVLNAAKQIASLGLQKAGYQYVNIDVSTPTSVQIQTNH